MALVFQPSHKSAYPPFVIVSDYKKWNCRIGMASNGITSLPILMKIRDLFRSQTVGHSNHISALFTSEILN